MLDKLTRGLSFSAQDHPSPAKPAGLGDPDKRASERAWANYLSLPALDSRR